MIDWLKESLRREVLQIGMTPEMQENVRLAINKWFDENVLEFGAAHTIAHRLYKNQGSQYNWLKRQQMTTLQSHLAESLVQKGFVDIQENEKDDPRGIITKFRMWAFKVPK